MSCELGDPTGPGHPLSVVPKETSVCAWCQSRYNRWECRECNEGYFNHGAQCFRYLENIPPAMVGAALGGTTYFVLIILTQAMGMSCEIFLILRLRKRNLMPRKELAGPPKGCGRNGDRKEAPGRHPEGGSRKGTEKAPRNASERRRSVDSRRRAVGVGTRSFAGTPPLGGPAEGARRPRDRPAHRGHPHVHGRHLRAPGLLRRPRVPPLPGTPRPPAGVRVRGPMPVRGPMARSRRALRRTERGRVGEGGVEVSYAYFTSQACFQMLPVPFLQRFSTPLIILSRQLYCSDFSAPDGGELSRSHEPGFPCC